MKHSRIGTYPLLILFLLITVTGVALPVSREKLEGFVGDKTTNVSGNKSRVRTQPKDSLKHAPLAQGTDSLAHDSIPTDSLHKKKQALDAAVNYEAQDSIVFTDGNWAYLYGKAQVKYKDMALNGELLTTNTDSSTVWAKYALDSLGKEYGYPEFTQGQSKYEAKSIKYNFKSKKGYITHVVTQQGDGYIVAEQAKKNEDGSFFMTNGKYTTCDDHDHPHFYLNLTKAKVRPGKDVVTGPAYLVVEDVPLPIAVPFAFFPFTNKYSSGILFPSYADELERGFGLVDGGYYFAINNNVDLSLTGDIYTKGSWGIAAASSYKKRYKYSGSFSGNYIVKITGDKEVPSSYAVSKDFSIKWSHSQDSKANAFRQLSASVNFQTSSYSHNSLYTESSSDYTSNTKSSSVSLTQSFPNSKWSLSAAMQITQRSSDSTVSVSLPSLSVTMSRLYPFKRKRAVGAERWYEKIYMSYSGAFSNSITTREDTLFHANLIKDWKNGARHSIPIGASFTLFNYINITPSITYNEQWHTHKVMKQYDFAEEALVPVDTTYGFFRTFDYSTAISFQTKLYGMYTPLIGGKYIKKIRHVFTPSISFSYSPDFAAKSYGFYQSYKYYDDGELVTGRYSPYSGNVYSPPSAGKTGSINFSLQNNLEMKVKSDKDTVGTKNISLIDNFTATTSYNMLATSFRWSNISTSTRLKLTKSLTINVNAIFDPYTYKLNNTATGLTKVDKLRVTEKGSIGRLMSTGYSFSPSINQDSFKKWFGKDKDKDKNGSKPDGKNGSGKPGDGTNGTNTNPTDSLSGGNKGGLLNGQKKDQGTYDQDGYLKNQVKWNLALSYGFTYAYNTSSFNAKTAEYNYALTQNLSISGGIQPTKNWNFSFSTSYIFDTGKFTYMTCNLTRDLHCFSLTASFIPIGPSKYYSVVLRVKSSMLQDLKYQQRNSSSSLDPTWP